MNEFNFNTEDNFIQPSGRKHLDELFDVEIKPAKGDESLRYSSPKGSNNEHKSEGETTRSPWQTLLAKMVIGFKNREPFGRVGMAILKNIDNAHRIILYKSKANMLAALTITQEQLQSRVYLHRQNCYWQFYDDHNVFWSLLFDRSTDESDFMCKLKACGFRLHLDVDIKPETAATTDDLKKYELENKSEMSKKSRDDSSDQPQTDLSKSVRIQEDQNTEQLIKNDNMRYERFNLLNRLTKIGVQQIPSLNEFTNLKNSAVELSDSDQESSGDRGSTVTVVGQPIYKSCSSQRSSNIVYSPAMSQNANSATVLQPAAVEAQVIQMMLVENRTQNTELRMNMDKLDSKMEKVLERIERIETGEKQDDELIKLEEQILELKKENRRLKKEFRNVNDRSDTNIEHVWRIYETELNSLGVSSSTNAYDMESLIGELLDKVTSHKNQQREKELQLKSTVSTAKEINDRYHIEKRAHNETLEKMEQMLDKLKLLHATVEAKTKNEVELYEQINKLKTKHATEITNVKVEMTQALKDIMNTLYHNLAKNIVDMDRIVPEEILPLIGKTIRQDTLSAVAKISR